MRTGRHMTIGGVLVLLFGVVFYLQGLSIVGPESSFMYSNPEWVGYGIQIAAVGASITVAGIVIWVRSNR